MIYILRKIKLPVLLLSVFFASCEKELETIPTDRFASDNIATSPNGLKALLFSAYNTNNRGDNWKNHVMQMECMTDIAFNSGGNANRQLVNYINFTLDSETGWLTNFWNPNYFAIRDCNLVIESLEAGSFEPEFESLIKAEARFIRAWEYAELYKHFGPVPLRTSTGQEGELARATDEEMRTFIESELLDIIDDLPAPGQEEGYGRATKGHALGTLVKFALNSRQWQKVVTYTQDLMNLQYYELYPTYRAMFFVENEQNKEMIMVWPSINEPGPASSWYPCGAFPPGFRRAENIPEFEYIAGQMNNFPTQYRLRDAFVDSFDPTDERYQAIVQVYENLGGRIINLRNNADDSRSLKFFDNDQVQNESGNDQIVIRYADILLARAEALNELNGPTQEAVDLVNKIRNRSNLGDYTLTDVGTKDNFNDIILEERGWEFYSEGWRREDLIRHDKLISNAQSRGITNAQDFHVLFPIPQNELNSNPNVEQNPGY